MFLNAAFPIRFQNAENSYVGGRRKKKGGTGVLLRIWKIGKICEQLYIWRITTNFANYLATVSWFTWCTAGEYTVSESKSCAGNLWGETMQRGEERGGLNRVSASICCQLLWNRILWGYAWKPCQAIMVWQHHGWKRWIEEACQKRTTHRVPYEEHLWFCGCRLSGWDSLLEGRGQVLIMQRLQLIMKFFRVRTSRLALRYVGAGTAVSGWADRGDKNKEIFRM